MIIDFTISNFRSIKNPVTLSFEASSDTHLEDYFVVKKGRYRLLKTATILGANASGKSNVLKAFYLLMEMLLSPAGNKNDEFDYKRFALDEKSQKEDSTMEVNFLCNEKRYHYFVQFNNKMVCREWLQCLPFDKSRIHKVFERITETDTLLSSITIGDLYNSNRSEFNKLKINLLHNRTVFGAFQTSNVEIACLKEIIDWAKVYFMPIVTPKTVLEDFVSRRIDMGDIGKEQIIDMIHHADVGIDGIDLKKTKKEIPQEIIDSVLNDDNISDEIKKSLKENPYRETVDLKMLHKVGDRTIPFDFEEESLGTQRYYGIAGLLLLLINESHFVTIDELESSMHPDLYSHFVTTYLSNAKESQMVFTTHMREFLNDRDLFRDDSLWITEKDESGATELYSFADFDSSVLRDTTNRFNAYKIGKLGGIPHTGSTYIEPLNSSNDEQE
ncbi:MAG: AAA family ATPase [Bacteroidales bacterium]|nr:AAA family ATPase [Bacteroidales bacterium]